METRFEIKAKTVFAQETGIQIYEQPWRESDDGDSVFFYYSELPALIKVLQQILEERNEAKDE